MNSIVFGWLLVTNSVLLVVVVHGRSTTTSSSNINHALIMSSCATTLYPKTCYSTLSSATLATVVATKNDLIHLAINKTKDTLQNNFHAINNLTASTPNLSKRAKIALHDCLQMITATLERLNMVIQDLYGSHPSSSSSPRTFDKSLLITLMSTTITNKETCLDGFSHDAPCKRLRKSIMTGQNHWGQLCSNTLAMIKNMTEDSTDDDNNKKMNNNVQKDDDDKWPEWLSTGDRKLLQSGGVVAADVTVAKDGSGDYTTVAAAVAGAPSRSKNRYVIKISGGVYRENVEIPSTKTNLMFIGDGISKTIITGSRSVAGGTTTFNSATVAAVGDGFLARDITFENVAGPSGHQAVALRVGSDLSAFYRCGIQGYQDTLYVHSNRQFYIDCFVVGTVDFIFGNAAVVFQDCDIQARRPNPKQKNTITAQGRTDPNQNTGIVIQKCTITASSDLKPVEASFPTYLGRPWKEYSRTVVMQSSISDVINPAGWYPWNGDFALNTLYYREYQNTGAGADTSKRVTWAGWGVITTTTEANRFTPGSFIGGGTWLPPTGFPFSLGLS